MTGHEALKSAMKFLAGACATTLVLCVPAVAADASGEGGFMVSDATGRPALPPPRPPPPSPDLLRPPELPFKHTKEGDMIVGDPEKSGYILTKDGTRITKDFIETYKETGGVRVLARAHRKTGMKEVCTRDPDGFVTQEAREKDGAVISRVSWSKNGKLVEYEPWANDRIFDSAKRVLEASYHSVGEQTTVQFQSPGKVYPGGSSILVRTEFRSRIKSERSASSASVESKDIRMKTEIRKLKQDRNSRFAVIEVLGGTMQASGWGKTRDEAIASALDQIAREIQIHVRSELTNYQASTRTRTAKGTTASSTEILEDKTNTRSKAAFKAYRIVAVKRDEEKYIVDVEAVPGAVVTMPSTWVCGYAPGLERPPGSDRPK